MKGLALLCLLAAVTATAALATDSVIWPMNPQDSTHTLFHSFGDYHTAWMNACADSTNFHFGIDLTDPTPSTEDDSTEDVLCVRPGYVSHVFWPDSVVADSPMAHDNYGVVICDTYDQQTGFGWCYQHIEDCLYTGGGLENNPWSPDSLFNGNYFSETARLGDIDNDAFCQGDTFSWTWTDDHMHFMRSEPIYSSTDPGFVNPLFYLDPAPVEGTSPSFHWSWMTQIDSLHPYRFFAIPQYPALADSSGPDWADRWVDLAACQSEIDSMATATLSGAIDLVLWMVTNGTGSTGSYPPYGCMPQRLEWWVERCDSSTSQWVEVEDSNGKPYHRYPFDFGDMELGGSSDWEKYKQLYFRFSAADFFEAGGYMCCLTNCSTDSTWDGIENIEENSWVTNIDKLQAGPTIVAEEMLFPDGRYRVVIRPWVFNGTTPVALTPAYAYVDLNNGSPVAHAAQIVSPANGTIWSAHWEAVEVANGLEVEFVIEEDEPVEAGQTLTATIVFSEPMNTASCSYSITAGKSPDYDDLEVTTTGWSCTNNPAPYYDTWTGTIEVPEEGASGRITLRIEAEDTDGNCLKDPADAFPSDDEYSDLYHGFGIAFGAEPGWSATLHSGVWGSPCLGDLDGDGDLDVAIQSRDGWVNCLDDTGTQFSGWPMSMGWVPTWTKTYSSVALADLDEDDALEVVATNPYGCRAYNLDGTTFGSWPYFSGVMHFSKASPAIGDVDGDGSLEVVLGRVDGDSTVDNATVICLETDGTLKWSQLYYGSLGYEMPILATPAIGDISSSHTGNEIAIATSQDFIEGYPYLETDTGYPNWVRLLDGSGNTLWTSANYLCQFWASPVVGDIDGDEVNEVVIGSSSNWDDGKKVFVFNGNTGALEHTWTVGGWVQHPAALADLDDDGVLDVIVGSNDHFLHAWSGDDHQALPGYPVDLGSQPGSPAVADIDGDFELEVIAGTSAGELWAINPDGSVCTGFPVSDGTYFRGAPAIGDLDGDGCLEVLVADQTDAAAYCYDMGSGTFPCEMPWRQFQHDSWNSGCYEADNTVPEAPTDLDATVTYNSLGYTANLTWDLSVNDPYSGSPEEPADVLSYQIYRAFPPSGYSILSRVHAGDGDYTDVCNDPQGTIARYVVTSGDGVNESEYSNEVRFRTVPGQNLAAGCHVTEQMIRDGRTSMEVSSRSTFNAGSRETGSMPMADAATGTRRLTDGETEEVYIPGAGVRAVVIDLGCSCIVGQIDMLEAGAEAAASTADPSVIEISADGTGWASFSEGRSPSGATARYVRISPAPITSEVFVWGSRAGEDTEELVIGIERCDGRWSLELPLLDDTSSGETGTLSVYDVTGRVLRSWNARPGEEVDWDGRTASGMQATPGCYFVRYEQGGEAVTRRLLVTAE